MTVSSRDCPFCGSDHKSKPFVTYQNGYHCYSCGAHKNTDRQFNIVVDNTKTHSQHHVTYTFTTEMLQWLTSYHITQDMIYNSGLGVVNDRLYLPYINTNTYQLRQLSPKMLRTFGEKPSTHYGRLHNSGTIIIVEDLISALRVNQQYNVFCMLGTSLSEVAVNYIMRNFSDVVIWADGDKFGQICAEKLLKTFTYLVNKYNNTRIFDVGNYKHVRNIVTNKDPKTFTNSEIESIVNIAPIKSK